MLWPSKKVRETFIQYFIRHSKYPHLLVPSSSIVPQNDPSLAFVNAGMNQFKDIILGMGRPKSSRVTNSQKCLRINDLSLVGADTYHHTFFEMLGNWSFANYFKAEACFMAWDLLTNVYKLDPKRLYVTYYAGGNSLPIDKETKEIWESIGVPKERVLPYGTENFWAMGPIGPCGPSTEIHYDHRGIETNPSEVNGDSGKVVEIWNLVFMQYNRTENGKLERLPLSHVVDTGAGLERLTAVLNNKVSNYDSDLFIPIFETVQKYSKVPGYTGRFSPEAELDTGYRIFADHLRAITVALSDGILPQTNHKIRKLIQRSLVITENKFGLPMKYSKEVSSFLHESVKAVSSSLSNVYPETEEMQPEIIEILKTEIDRFVEYSKNVSINVESRGKILPDFLIADFPSLGRIKKDDLEKVKIGGLVDGITAFKWYDSLGVTEEAAEDLCNALNIKFDKRGMQEEMAKVKKGFRDEISKQILLSTTNNFIRKIESSLASYEPNSMGGGICTPSLKISDTNPVFINWIFDQWGEPLEKPTEKDEYYWIILNKTPFIPGGKTMTSDQGSLTLDNNCRLNVTKVDLMPSGWILHRVTNDTKIGFRLQSKVKKFEIDNAKLFGREVSAQAIYNLQRWLYKNYKVVRFTNAFVSDEEIQLEFTILNGNLGADEIHKLEEDLYQYGIPLVVTKKLWKQNGVYELICATGVVAETARRHGTELISCIQKLEELSALSSDKYESVRTEMKNLFDELQECLNDKCLRFPHELQLKTENSLEKTKKILNKNEEIRETKFMTNSIQKMNEPFIVKCFDSELEFSSLKKITRVAENKPVLILICSSEGFVQGRCSVPENLQSDCLSAEEWMSQVTNELNIGTGSAPKGQDSRFVNNLKRIRVPDAKHKVERSLEKAVEYVSNASRKIKVGQLTKQ